MYLHFLQKKLDKRFANVNSAVSSVNLHNLKKKNYTRSKYISTEEIWRFLTKRASAEPSTPPSTIVSVPAASVNTVCETVRSSLQESNRDGIW
mmetsp:Transcript_29996/g.39454  ORF Transcript_29996/g.39454 Transcript_29996/m.39454 type:complete len:93 (-) Transcript_29996:820-1098(-)